MKGTTRPELSWVSRSERHHQQPHHPARSPKPQTSREVIQANVDLLILQLEAGHSEGLTAYLTAMGRSHNYSFGLPGQDTAEEFSTLVHELAHDLLHKAETTDATLAEVA